MIQLVRLFYLENLRQDARWQTLNAEKSYCAEHWKLKYYKITLLLKYIDCYQKLKFMDEILSGIIGMKNVS